MSLLNPSQVVCVMGRESLKREHDKCASIGGKSISLTYYRTRPKWKGLHKLTIRPLLSLLPRNHDCLIVPKINWKWYNERPFQGEAPPTSFFLIFFQSVHKVSLCSVTENREQKLQTMYFFSWRDWMFPYIKTTFFYWSHWTALAMTLESGGTLFFPWFSGSKCSEVLWILTWWLFLKYLNLSKKLVRPQSILEWRGREK